MSQPYSELVLNAPFLLVKGFLMGFMHGRGENFYYFFQHKKSIKRDAMGDMLREVLALECYCSLCLPNYMLSFRVDGLIIHVSNL